MADRFVPLHEFVLPVSEPETELSEPAPATLEVQARPEFSEALAEARRFRAAVRDAVDVTVRALLCDVAAEVVARELQLAPADVDKIVTRACARFGSEGVVRVRVHPEDAARIENPGFDVVSDLDLRRGDVLLDVRSGTIDVSLGARLAGILDGVAP